MKNNYVSKISDNTGCKKDSMRQCHLTDEEKLNQHCKERVGVFQMHKDSLQKENYMYIG